MSTSILSLDLPLDRRRFLAVAGLGLAAAFLPAAAAAGPSLRIGLLLPASTRHPTLATNLRAGAEIALAQAGGQVAGRPVSLVTAPTQPRPSQVLQGLGAFLERERVDAMIGLASSGSSRPLQRLLGERGVPMLLSDIGADVLRSPAGPLLFRSSLGAWQSALAAGRWAVGALGRRVAIVSAFYESGYDLPAAVRLGVESAGGLVTGVYVTHNPAGGDLDDTLRQVAAGRPDLLVLLSSGRPAAEFAAALGRSGLAGRLPLVASPWALETPAPALEGAFSVQPWADDHPAAAASAFRQAYQAAFGTPPDAVAALGYDAMSLMLAAAARPAPLAEALAGASIDGVRGPLTIDAASHETIAPLYLRQARWDGTRLSQRTLTTLPPLDPQAGAAIAQGPKTGWANAYLCV